MYCSNCGSKLNNDNICPKCGFDIEKGEIVEEVARKANKIPFWQNAFWTTLAFLIPIFGLVMYLVGEQKIRYNRKNILVATILGLVFYVLLYIAYIVLIIYFSKKGDINIDVVFDSLFEYK